MMTLVEKGKNYRIFSDKKFGLIPYYVLEDTTKATVRNGTTYNVEITTHYFQTLKQVKGKIK